MPDKTKKAPKKTGTMKQQIRRLLVSTRNHLRDRRDFASQPDKVVLSVQLKALNEKLRELSEKK